MAQQTLEQIKKIRLEKVQKLRELGINPYPSKVIGKPQSIVKALELLGKEAEVAGRLMSWREHGNTVFADLKDESGQIQLWFQKNNLGDSFKTLRLFDVGDFLFAKGPIVKTRAGQISVDVSGFQILSKSIRPLPSVWYGVKDVEEKYRKRYLDLLLNEGALDRFKKRSLLIREVRKYLDSLGFYEVETPTLQPLYGGANAKPFKTHHNALDYEFYLRIADELYLKRLLVGGFEKVYEICKDFRNEGLDQTHSPEFTMVEYYEANADYQRVMDVTEGLFKHLAEKIYGKMEMQVEDKTIDISQKWPRVEMTEAINTHLRIDVEKLSDKELIEYCQKEKIEVLGGETKGQLIYTIFEHKVTDNLIDPTWIIDYPRDVSPLSKAHPVKDGWVERFEGYIGGKEICDGWSELNDPIIQRERFESDVKMTRKDKSEAQQVDEDFIEAMEYGMPPIGGIGIGIDRLTMFFTNTWSIKEVILFPTLKPDVTVKPPTLKVKITPESQKLNEKNK
jgi:lysyl-tRNA synthetase, class II